MKTRIKIILGAFSFFLFCGASTFFGSPADAQIQTFPVIQVVNGGTIVTDIRGKKEIVKLLGIQTPTATECFGKAAEDKLKSYINDKSVILINDNTKGNRDSAGELIRYIYLPDSKRTFVNGELVKQGYAYSDKQDKTKLLNKFNSLEAYAKSHSLGIWEACPTNSVSSTTTQAQIYVAPVTHYVAPTTPPVSTQSSTGLSNNN
jgi:endonuclease YncB( thermonuclease family)